MEPLKLTLQNFTCYKHQEISFAEDGIYVIYGEEAITHKKNGIGKTAISEGIRFALFGTTKYRTIDQPIRFGQSEMVVAFEFTHNNDVFKVVRSRKRKATTAVELWKNNVNQHYETAGLVNKAIEEILGVTKEIYENSFYLGKSDLTAFTASSLINFLKSVLKLNKFDLYREKAKEVRHNVDMKLSKLLGIQETLSQLQSVNHTKEELKSTIESRTKKIEQGKAKKKDLKTQSVNVRNKRSNMQAELSTDNSLLRNARSNLDKADKDGICPMCNQSLKDELVVNQLKSQAQAFEEKIKIKKPILDELIVEATKYETAMDKIDDIVDDLKSEISEAQSQLNLLSQADQFDKDEIEKQYSKFLALKGKAEQVIKLFSPTELPLHILNKYLPVLELTVNCVLGSISDFSIEILTQKLTQTGTMKKTCEIVLYRHGQEYDVTNLSGGEETLINMAFRIGISKMFLRETDFQLLIIDEGFGALGDVNQAIVVEMLKGLKETFRKIVIISHVEFIRDSFSKEHRIKIIKEGDTSTII